MPSSFDVIPAPQRASLAGGKLAIGSDWRVSLSGIPEGDIAPRTLIQDFRDFHGVSLGLGEAPARTIRLSVEAGAVKTGAAAESERQAYRLRIEPERIEIAGNAAPGLFYGVQTLVQLARREDDGRLAVPLGVIEDWPALPLRFLHWDAQQHQDRIETLKRYIDWTARFKANMIAFQLEDKFEFPSHPVIGAPGAYTSAEMQELTDYALERHIQIVPMIQAPAHFSWALKHPEFADLRSDGNNYAANTCDPRALEFIFSLYDDIMNATRGVHYFFVSTDEIYYAGIDPRCGRPYTPENRSLAWVEFVQKAHEHVVKKHGRTMLIWGEYPLLPQHVKLLPPDIIDGVSMEPEYLPEQKRIGMRNLFYVWTQGVELHFPDYFGWVGEKGWRQGNLARIHEQIARGRHWQGNPVGVFGANWDASGPHNETFWLGWSGAAQWGWNPGTVTPERHAADFFRLYYGPRVEGMAHIYALLQQQARAWERSWDQVPSRVRGPAYGNSRGKGIGTQRRDMTLYPPPLPRLPDLRVVSVLRVKYRDYFAEARRRMPENEMLQVMLATNLGRADRNRYNLEVLLANTKFIERHWRLLMAMEEAERSLERARAAAAGRRPAEAVGHLLAAAEGIEPLVKERSRALAALTAVYEKSRYPRGQSVGGRVFVDVNDDSKDYWAQRRPDMSYLTAPEESIGLEDWIEGLREVIAQYARQHKVPVKELEPEG